MPGAARHAATAGQMPKLLLLGSAPRGSSISGGVVALAAMGSRAHAR